MMTSFNPLVFGLTSIAAIIAVVLFVRYRHVAKTDPRTLTLGRLFLAFLFFVFIAVNGLFLTFEVELFFVAEILILFFAFAIFSVVLMIGIIVESFRIWRRESHSIANLLLPIILIAYWLVGLLYDGIVDLPEKYEWLKLITAVYPVLVLYIAWQFVVFFVTSVLYGRVAKVNRDNFVVLGAGLVGGEKVGRLLAARIEVAANQMDANSTLVMSGGQGGDEKLPESHAMRDYAIENLNVAPERIQVEDKSRTTFENLTFSKAIVGDDFTIATSEYHVLRAVLFAKNIGLSAQGIGGKTAMYYRIPAFIREFLAVMFWEKKKHAIFFGLILLLPILLLVLQQFVV
jgi:uncharacterized SAM-binding protein YcdF (DUF218 family)